MQPLLLIITFKEWIRIGVIALFFSVLLSLICYFLVNETLLNALFFGSILGLCLFICAFLFTTVLNQVILPRIPKNYWLACAGLSSFLSGFLATVVSYYLCLFLHVTLLEKFEANLLFFAFLIGILSYGIAFLLYQFVMMSYAKEYHEKLLIESRLKSLERQLNPHFLFNALNSVSELLHVNPHTAEKALLSLSDFLRSSMKESSRISLKEELDNVVRYVNLENIRFDGKIMLRISVDERFYLYPLPKFSIQLLVENAIKHGYNGKVLHIWIEAHYDEALHLYVGNDGNAIRSQTFGIGLSNLQERLSLLSKGSLSLKEQNPTLFEMTLRHLP